MIHEYYVCIFYLIMSNISLIKIIASHKPVIGKLVFSKRLITSIAWYFGQNTFFEPDKCNPTILKLEFVKSFEQFLLFVDFYQFGILDVYKFCYSQFAKIINSVFYQQNITTTSETIAVIILSYRSNIYHIVVDVTVVCCSMKNELI